MEVLCGLYNLPTRLVDRQRGEQQYAALENIVADASEVSSLLKRLEERYDKEQQQDQPPPPPLSSKVEDFLRELGGDLGSPE